MKRINFVVVPLVAGVAMAFAAGAQAAKVTTSKVDGKGVATITLSPAEQVATASLMTRDRIAKAAPMRMPVDRGSSVVLGLPDDFEALAGEPGNVPAGRAAPDADSFARMAFPQDWAAMDAAALEEGVLDLVADELAGTTQTYTYYDVNGPSTALAPLQTMYPHKWVGRLTFKTSATSGTSYCSATAISNNHIVTAAHCVYDTALNKWYQSWVFTPAYKNGNAPYGNFAASSCTILTAWINLTGSFSITGWTKYDVAVCDTGLNASGKTLNSMVGYAGRSWDWPYTRLHFVSGYPWKTYQNVNITSYPGQYLRACVSESFSVTTDTLGTGCYWGPGISGGSWLKDYKIGAVAGSVNSVNSGFYIGTQNMYGPRFTSTNIVPLCTAEGC